MNHSCLQCKEAGAKSVISRVEFIHEGLLVSVFKPGGACIDCCKKDFLLRFNMYSHCIKYANGNITEINWELFQKDYERINDIDNVREFFMNLGIFSISPAENWQIVADGSLNLNPKYSSYIMYFTNFIDAVNYAKERFSQTQYSWNLQKIAKVCNRREVCELDSLNRNEIAYIFDA